MQVLRGKYSLSSFQTIIIGFAGTILIGSLLLMLPIASASGKITPFNEALFTATSATCVTVLVVHDTATYWTLFGQVVILALIQIGGMGVVTMAALLTILSGKKIGLMQRNTMQEAISARSMGGIVKLTSFIVKCTILVECIGAFLMMPVFCRDFGIGKGIWYSFFHSISAFCNAGFDLMGVQEKYSSLTHYVSNPLINLTIMGLIIVGGIGFLTWDDIKRKTIHFHRYHTQSKIILSVTFILILLPTIYFFFCEFTDMPLKTRILASMFQAVTPRTAGFNTVDLTKISEPGRLLTIALMVIGGSPGSTAGGIKTTTIAILFASALATFHRNEDANVFQRRISEEALKNASAIFMVYVSFVMIGGSIISHIEGFPLLTCLYEAASAVGTVGLTLGITTKIGVVSQSILIFLMYFGRVGALTLVFATLSPNKRRAKTRMPLATIAEG